MLQFISRGMQCAVGSLTICSLQFEALKRALYNGLSDIVNWEILQYAVYNDSFTVRSWKSYIMYSVQCKVFQCVSVLQATGIFPFCSRLYNLSN